METLFLGHLSTLSLWLQCKVDPFPNQYRYSKNKRDAVVAVRNSLTLHRSFQAHTGQNQIQNQIQPNYTESKGKKSTWLFIPFPLSYYL
jgi:hypothetical protein